MLIYLVLEVYLLKRISRLSVALVSDLKLLVILIRILNHQFLKVCLKLDFKPAKVCLTLNSKPYSIFCNMQRENHTICIH